MELIEIWTYRSPCITPWFTRILFDHDSVWTFHPWVCSRLKEVCMVCVFSTFNRSFYPSTSCTSGVRAECPCRFFNPREIKVLCIFPSFSVLLCRPHMVVVFPFPLFPVFAHGSSGTSPSGRHTTISCFLFSPICFLCVVSVVSSTMT